MRENCGAGIHAGSTPETPIHHVAIRYSLIHGSPGGDPQAGLGDFFLIKGNVAQDNANHSLWGHGGISVFRSVAVETNEAAPPQRAVVRRNLLPYGNRQMVPSREIGAGAPTDGNGIVVDSDEDTGYPYRTLVEGNLVFGNGGTVIHAFRSAHVDIVRNASVRNGANPEQDGGEVLAVASRDVRALGNVAVARPGRRLNARRRNRDVASGRNVPFGAVPPELSGPGDVLADPRLAAPALDGPVVDLAPDAGSPAVDAGLAGVAPALDRCGRPGRDAARDAGAVEGG